MSALIVSAKDAHGRRFVDARPGLEGFTHGHVRGAVHVDLDRDLSVKGDPARGGRHPLPDVGELEALLGRLGIGREDDVVVYDAAGGANAASRFAWMVRAIGGAKSVALLDGGWDAALSAGLPVESGAPSQQPAPRSVHTDARRYGAAPIATIDDVAAALEDSSWLVLDVRAPARYRGETEPFDPVPGHIPGARNAPYADNLDASGHFLSRDALREKYEALLGETPPERVIVSCGSGVTACHTLLALEEVGLGGAALYVGSYGEWCRSRPIKAGSEP